MVQALDVFLALYVIIILTKISEIVGLIVYCIIPNGQVYVTFVKPLYEYGTHSVRTIFFNIRKIRPIV